MNGALYVPEWWGHRVSVWAPPDATAPSTTHAVAPATPSSGWYKAGPVNVTLTATDNAAGVGVREIRYAVNMGAEQVATGSTATVTLPSEGIHSVAFWAIDNAGNVEGTEYATVKIDTTAPVPNALVLAGTLSLGGSDNLSGIAQWTYSVDGGAAQAYTGPVVLPAGAKVVRYAALCAIAVRAIRLASIAVNPKTVVGGARATATLVIGSPAPSGGLAVAISATGAGANPPASVVVPAGATSVEFDIPTAPVPSDNTVSVRAQFGSASVRTQFVVARARLASIAFNPGTVNGGTSVRGTVALTGPAPVGGVTVTIRGISAIADVPTAVSIPAGALSANFDIPTRKPAASTTVNVTAAHNGETKTGRFTILP